jgi:NAD dependent epimerase/dehydratase family.
MKNVLIIGGSGTISQPITKALANDPMVNCYVLNRGNKKDLDNTIALRCDMNDIEKMEQILLDYEFDIVCNFVVFTKEQAKAQIDLFKNKIKQYIFISTVCVLDREKMVNITEESPVYNQYSRYGQEKLACEELFLKAYETEGFPVTIVRPSQTYDDSRIPLSVKAGSCYSVISRILNNKEVIIHGDGTSLWACTHSEDFKKAFLVLIGNEKTIGEIYQITTSELVNWNLIYQSLSKLLNKKLKVVYMTSDLLSKSKTYNLEESIKGDKKYSVVFSQDKIKEIYPDFNCVISIEEGLKRYLDFIEKYPKEKKEDVEFDQWCDNVISVYKEAIKKVENII